MDGGFNSDLMRERLIKAREGINCNRKAFAEMLSIPYRTITNYENGQREPGSDYITRVADVCGVTTDWLLGKSDDMRGDGTFSVTKGNEQLERLADACRSLNPPAIEKVITYAKDLAWNPENKK